MRCVAPARTSTWTTCSKSESSTSCGRPRAGAGRGRGLRARISCAREDLTRPRAPRRTRSRPPGRHRRLFIPVLGHRLVLSLDIPRRDPRPVGAASLEQLRDACLELVPPPRPDWSIAENSPPSKARRELSELRAVFPLIPRRRLTGLPLGLAERPARTGERSRRLPPLSPRRPDLDDRLARKRAALDRARQRRVRRARAIRRGSPARRDRIDRRPRWRSTRSGRHGSRSPGRHGWQRRAIIEATVATRGAVGYLDFASASRGSGGSFWVAPRSRSPLELVEEHLRTAGFDAGETSLERAIEYLTAGIDSARRRVVRLRALGLPRAAASRALADSARTSLGARARRDPGPCLGADLPVDRPGFAPIRRPARRCPYTRCASAVPRRGRSDNAASRARAGLLDSMSSLGLDPVLDRPRRPGSVEQAFIEWAENRRRALYQRR